MVLNLLLFASSLIVAACAAYFSVLGIATLFSGSYYAVMIMASSLEIGKLVATTYLHHYWSKTSFLLKTYLLIAVMLLMGITSLGIFGYLSAAYSVNSAKFTNIDSQIEMLVSQKNSIDSQSNGINERIKTLNEARRSQEARLGKMTARNSAPIYADIERTGTEVKSLNERVEQLNTNKLTIDSEIAALKSEIAKAKDIGTFKFIAGALNCSLDTVVMLFICIIICVFDPLAIALLLSYNTTRGTVHTKDKSVDVSHRVYDLSDGL